MQNDPSENQSENQSSPSGSSPSNSSEESGLFQKLLTGIMFAVAFVAMIFIKPAQYFKRQVYDKSPAPFFFGVLASMAAGIATGYPMWLAHVSLTTWVPLAVLAVVGTYYYLWPALYMAAFRWAFQSSRFLWRNVPSAKGSRSGDPVWLSQLLSGIAIVAVVLACGYEAWVAGNALFDYLNWTSVLGKLVAAAISIVVGGVAGWVTGFVAITIIIEAGMPALAVSSGAAVAWRYQDLLSGVVAQYELPHSLTYGLQALVVLAVAGYAFPLAHVVISRGLNFVGKYLRPLLKRLIDGFVDAFGNFLDGFYNDHDDKYVSFLQQAAGIAITYGIANYVWGWSASFGLIAASALTAVAALASYLTIGSLVRKVSNMTVAVVASLSTMAAVAYFPALQYSSHGVIIAVQVVLTGLVMALFALPLAYRLLKFVANPLLASWLSTPLNTLQRSLTSEIFAANSNTYSDRTGFETLFVHLVNISASVAGFFAVSLLVFTLSISGWPALVMPIVTVVFAYLFLGKLLLRFGNHLIGGLVGLAFGVFVGVQVFAHYDQNYWYAIPAFAATMALTATVIFPVVYVLLRAVINAARGMDWLLPLVGGVYNFFFGFVAKVWTQFLIVYRRLEASFSPVWKRLSATWDESWENAKAAINKAWNSTKK